MPDDLTPASPDDLRATLSWALRRDRGKPTRQHADVAAEAAASHLIEAMRRAGFVVMRRPPIGDSAPRPRPADDGVSG